MEAHLLVGVVLIQAPVARVIEEQRPTTQLGGHQLIIQAIQKLLQETIQAQHLVAKAQQRHTVTTRSRFTKNAIGGAKTKMYSLWEELPHVFYVQSDASVMLCATGKKSIVGVMIVVVVAVDTDLYTWISSKRLQAKEKRF